MTDYVAYQILTAAQLNASIDGLGVALAAEVTRAEAAESILAPLASVVKPIASIAALRAATSSTVTAPMVYVQGYYAGSDGGEGPFWLSSDTTSADNGGTIVVDASGRRWYRETGGQSWSAAWFGLREDGASDNLTAWTLLAAAAVLLPNGASILFPPGKYLFSAAATFTFPAGREFNLKVEGYGAVLYWPHSSGGITFAKSLAGHSVSAAGLHITTGVVDGGNGLSVTQTDPLLDFFQDSFRDIVFRGDDNNGHTGGSFYWSNGSYMFNNSGTNWSGVTCYGGNVSTGVYGGAGINFQGSGAGGSDGPNYSIYHNLTSIIGNGLHTGIVYNSFAQGLTLTQSNFQNSNNGLLVPNTATGLLSQLQISDSQFACTIAQIAILASVGNVMIHDNDIFGVAGQSCIFLNGSQGYTIANNTCAVQSTTGSFGIAVANNSGFPSTITGNGINGAGTGIFLDSGSNTTIVSGNAISNCTTPINDIGTGNTIIGNFGVPPVTSAPSVGASPYSYTAGSRPEVLYLAASTSITSVTQEDATSILPAATGANQTFTIHLAPHAVISIGYTGTLTARGTKL